MYASFKIRATDGLLQRFLKKMFRGHVNQGAMQSYWFSGKNFDFVYLYSLVEQAAIYRSIATRNHDDASSHDVDVEASEAFLTMVGNYFDSFGGLAKRLWSIVSGPWRGTGRDLKDFLADDNVDDQEAESDGNVHRMLDRERDRENDACLTQEEQDRIARYQLEDEEAEEFAEDDLQDSNDDGDSEEENEEVQNIDTSSSSEDEWIQGITNKRKPRSPAQAKSRKRRSRTSLAAADDSQGPKEPKGDSHLISGGSRKRRVIEESDDE